MDIQTLLIIFLIVVAMIAVVSIKVRALEVQVKNMPEYQNMEKFQDKVQRLHGDNRKIEGQLEALEKAFTELTHRVNALPRDIKQLLDK